MEIRKASLGDVPAVAEIYERIHDQEAAGKASIGWVRGVYPTEKTAADAVARGDLFVGLERGKIVSAAVINQNQLPEYVQFPWEHPAEDSDVMVLHTLVVDPDAAGRGCGKQFVAFYEQYARMQGCHFLRMDTQKKNSAARSLYQKLGFKEIGIIDCKFFNSIQGIQLLGLEKAL